MKTCYVITEVRAIADLVAPGNLAPGWTITRINVPSVSRGEGYGTALLRTICANADAEGVDLWLEILPSGPLDYDALLAWYDRHDFKITKIGYMRRRPRKI